MYTTSAPTPATATSSAATSPKSAAPDRTPPHRRGLTVACGAAVLVWAAVATGPADAAGLTRRHASGEEYGPAVPIAMPAGYLYAVPVAALSGRTEAQYVAAHVADDPRVAGAHV